MSAKKTPARKTSNTTKRKTQTKNSNKKQALKQQNERRELTAIFMFVMGILMVFLVFMEGTSLWRVLHNLLFGVFGVIAYVVPVILLIVGVLLTTERLNLFYKHRSLQIFLLITMICASVQIFTGEEPGPNGLFFNLRILYSDGQNKIGGGLVGAILGWPLYYLFGKSGASIIIVLGMLVFALLVTGSTLRDFFATLKKPVDKFSSAYKEHIEERIRIQDERENAKFNIDIPIDGSSDEKKVKINMPNHPVTSSKLKKFGEAYDIPLDEKKPSVKTVSVKDGDPPITVSQKNDMDDIIETDDDGNEIVDIEMLIRKAMPEEKALSLQNAHTSNENTFPDQSVKLMESTEEIGRLGNDTESPISRIDIPFKSDENNDEETYSFPPLSLLSDAKIIHDKDAGEELRQNAELLVDTLKSFGVHTKILDITRGPTVTRYELQPSAGVRINRITNLADDIALNLASAGVRIEAPIPNKAAVGIEVPNKKISMVKIKEMISSETFHRSKSSLSVALGKDISGKAVIADIGKMPHVLIAGATGSGKSVCINTIIISLLYKSSPEDVRLLMIDPKVVELGVYNGIPHLLVPVVTDPRKAAGALNWAVTEMLNRYKLFADCQVRDINGYNLLATTVPEMKPLPQIVVIIDELADLMMVAPNEVEDAICRLAQMARAAGMHLVIATQRPSVDVITGVIKANIPSRIAFSVSSSIDSRTILDGSGAEKLLGRGDMLFSPMGSPKPSRIQGCFVDDKEVEKVVKYVKDGFKTEYDNDIMDEIERQAVQEKGSSGQKSGNSDDSDEMLPKAIECVIEAGQASTSMLQRKLKLGYGRAARIMDMMEERGIIGPSEGSKPRQVNMTRQQWMEMNMSQNDG